MACRAVQRCPRLNNSADGLIQLVTITTGCQRMLCIIRSFHCFLSLLSHSFVMVALKD